MGLRSLKGSRQRLLYEINDFSGGMNTVDTDTKLKENEFRILKNVNVKSRGQISRRNGFKKIISHTLPEDLLLKLNEEGLEKFEKLNNTEFFMQTTKKAIITEEKTDNDWNNIFAYVQTITGLDENEEYYLTNLNEINEIMENKQKILTFRLNSATSQDFEISQKSKIDVFDLENKGFNLWLNYYYTYNQLVDFFKDDEIKILKDTDIIGYKGITDLVRKKISKNTYLYKILTSGLTNQEGLSLQYNFEISHIVPNATVTTIKENSSDSFFFFSSTPNVQFKIIGNIINAEAGEAYTRQIAGQSSQIVTKDRSVYTFTLLNTPLRTIFSGVNNIIKITSTEAVVLIKNYKTVFLEQLDDGTKVPLDILPNNVYNDFSHTAEFKKFFTTFFYYLGDKKLLETSETSNSRHVLPSFEENITSSELDKNLKLTMRVLRH